MNDFSAGVSQGFLTQLPEPPVPQVRTQNLSIGFVTLEFSYEDREL